MTGEGDAVSAARAFVEAIAWGEHHRVWDLLGPEGRRVVLRVATKRGMDAALAARLRDGTAAAVELDQFLTDLVNGLRVDLIGTDIDQLNFVPDPDVDQGRSWVTMTVTFPEALGQGAGVPVGTVELAREVDGWRIERLHMRPGIGSGPTL